MKIFSTSSVCALSPSLSLYSLPLSLSLSLPLPLSLYLSLSLDLSHIIRSLIHNERDRHDHLVYLVFYCFAFFVIDVWRLKLPIYVKTLQCFLSSFSRQFSSNIGFHYFVVSDINVIQLKLIALSLLNCRISITIETKQNKLNLFFPKNNFENKKKPLFLLKLYCWVKSSLFLSQYYIVISFVFKKAELVTNSLVVFQINLDQNWL